MENNYRKLCWYFSPTVSELELQIHPPKQNKKTPINMKKHKSPRRRKNSSRRTIKIPLAENLKAFGNSVNFSCPIFQFWRFLYLGVSKNSGTPKWMVKIRETPISKWMIWGVKSPYFWVDTHLHLQHCKFTLGHFMSRHNSPIFYTSPGRNHRRRPVSCGQKVYFRWARCDHASRDSWMYIPLSQHTPKWEIPI